MWKQNVSGSVWCNKTTTTQTDGVYNTENLQLHGKTRALHSSPEQLRITSVSDFPLKLSQKRTKRTTGYQSLAVSDSSSQSCRVSPLHLAERHLYPTVYVLTCVDINTHSRPVESIHAQTEAAFKGPEKLSLRSANTRAKHTACVLIRCHNLSLAFPTAPSGEDHICKNTHICTKKPQAVQTVDGRRACQRAWRSQDEESCR